MIEMNAVAAGTELDAARDAGREGASAGWCAWSAGEAFSLVVRPDVNMHAFHGLPFVAAMGMMDALVGTASTPGLGLAGKVGIEWPSNIVCGAPAFETPFARVAVSIGKAHWQFTAQHAFFGHHQTNQFFCAMFTLRFQSFTTDKVTICRFPGDSPAHIGG